MKKIFSIIILLIHSILVGATGSLSLSAPSKVGVEDQFRVVYSLTDLKDPEFHKPKFSSDFQVVGGPMQSTNHSMQVENGSITSTSTIKITYILRPNKIGEFVLPKGVVDSEGNTYSSNEATIIVVEGSLAQQQQQNSNFPFGNAPFSVFGFPFSGGFGFPQMPSVPQRRTREPEEKYNPEYAFLRTEVKKTSVYENEVFVATINLYTRYGYEGRLTQIPDMTGFISEYVEVDNQGDSYETTIKDLKYKVCPLAKFVLTPTKTGKLKIGECEFQSILVVNQYGEQVKRNFKSAPVTINVKDLPERPSGFSGGVGKMNVTTELIPSSGFKANETITYRMRVEGSGNLKLVSSPTISFPSDFETFSSKPTNNIKYNAKGETGEKIIDYVVVPRSGGEFVIPSVDFVYFDLATNKYKTIKTEEYKISVEKNGQSLSNSPAQVNHKEVDLLNSDINFIKTGDVSLTDKDDIFLFSSAYWLWILLPLLIFVLLTILLKRYIKQNSNESFVKHKRANKQAIKRMKSAKAYMDSDDKNNFYEEVMKALFGYIGDKLNIPISELNKDNINIKLKEFGVEETLISEFLDVLNSSEFARFAPTDSQESMESIYQKSIDIIGNLEDNIKRIK